MVQKSLFSVRLLDKIGAPLVSAIESAPPEGETAAAEMMAKMLGQAVKMSIGLAAALNVEETEEQADSTRLSLAALAAPLLADFYRQHKRAPEEADIARMTKSLEAVLAFADKFTPAAQGQSRLSTIDQDLPFFDETQAVLTSLQALTPVILAINEFAFGQSEAKLLQEVSDRLEKNAVRLSGDDKNKLGQIMVLKALANIYADCHLKEVQRMSTQDDEKRETPTLEPVWKNFDRQVKMMEVLTGVEGSRSSVSAATPTTPLQAPETSAPVNAAAKEESIDAAPAASGGSPMGFFKSGDEAAASDKPVESTQTPPVNASDEETSSDSSPPSNPMGFFKPGAKKDEESS